MLMLTVHELGNYHFQAENEEFQSLRHRGAIELSLGRLHMRPYKFLKGRGNIRREDSTILLRSGHAENFQVKETIYAINSYFRGPPFTVGSKYPVFGLVKS